MPGEEITGCSPGYVDLNCLIAEEEMTNKSEEGGQAEKRTAEGIENRLELGSFRGKAAPT